MKKLDYNHLTTGTLTVDASHLIGVVNDLIDLVNSQQEAIEKLESKVWTADFIEKYRPALESLAKADDKPEYEYGNSITKVKLDGTVLTVPDTHRTEKVDPRDMASRNPSPEAKKALETAVQEAQEDINRISTHRTVTLRIPKGMSIVEAIEEAYQDTIIHTDTDLQKALDEVQPNE